MRHRHIERVGGDLPAHRLQALADAGRADIHRDRTVGFDVDAGVLLGAGRAALHEATERDAVIAPVNELALERELVAPLEFGEATVECHSVVAAVEFFFLLGFVECGDRVRHLRLAHQIAPPKFHRIDAELRGRDVDQPLAKEVGLEPPRAAIGADRRLVGEHRVRLNVHVVDVVGAGGELRDIARRDRAVVAHVRARIDPHLAGERDDPSVAGAADLQLAVHLA